MGAKKVPAVPPIYRPNRQTAVQAKFAGGSGPLVVPRPPAVFLPVRRPTTGVIQRADFDFGDIDSMYGPHGRGRSNSSGSESDGESPGSKTRTPPAPVSFKIIHKHLGDLKEEGDSNTMTLGRFDKQGRAVVECSLMGPASGRTHYEVICRISGLYGMTKYIVFHITSAGYFAIYNARAGDPGFTELKTAPPLDTMNSSDKLYSEFLAMARTRGAYRAGNYTCENFAREFFERITGVDVEAYTM